VTRVRTADAVRGSKRGGEKGIREAVKWAPKNSEQIEGRRLGGQIGGRNVNCDADRLAGNAVAFTVPRIVKFLVGSRWCRQAGLRHRPARGVSGETRSPSGAELTENVNKKEGERTTGQ